MADAAGMPCLRFLAWACLHPPVTRRTQWLSFLLAGGRGGGWMDALEWAFWGLCAIA